MAEGNIKTKDPEKDSTWCCPYPMPSIRDDVPTLPKRAYLAMSFRLSTVMPWLDRTEDASS